jgi:hypothetical protein
MWLQFAFSSLLIYVSGKSCIHTANLLVAVSPAPPPPSVFRCWFPTMLFISSFLVYLFSVHVAHPAVCLNCVHYCAVSLPQAANFHTLSFINDTVLIALRMFSSHAFIISCFTLLFRVLSLPIIRCSTPIRFFSCISHSLQGVADIPNLVFCIGTAVCRTCFSLYTVCLLSTHNR